MIEAVNASMMNSGTVRAVAEQVSSAQSLAANPARVQKAAVSAPYLSPYVRLNPDTKPVMVLRDSDTGASLTQYPTPAQIRAYQAAQAQARVVAEQSQPAAEASSSPAPEVTYEEAKAVLQSSVQYQEVSQSSRGASPSGNACS
jgi:hypothetical protein